ncbi:hypothetical protein MANES_11G108801v8 [Manihot esculenta]|uniref:Uncharacterized protein n=1 Tax=Manihot esculenta TaxID=3983 RepID=A0ACB7GV80_MANES|nr:hypothetical protein MANES_11G108801v8 [Manihot esculenta]
MFLQDIQSFTSNIEFPKLHGQDPNEWIVHAEQYFEKFIIHYEMKIYKVLSTLEGPFFDWFRGLRKQNPFPSWERFKYELLQHFGEANDNHSTVDFIADELKG